jgi:hypothetical protein
MLCTDIREKQIGNLSSGRFFFRNGGQVGCFFVSGPHPAGLRRSKGF